MHMGGDLFGSVPKLEQKGLAPGADKPVRPVEQIHKVEKVLNSE